MFENLLLRHINFRSPYDLDLVPGLRPEIAWSGSCSGAFTATRDDIFSWSVPRLSCAGTARGWRIYWRLRSGQHVGRTRLSRELRVLIATMASENSLWGTERIRGKLLNLGIVVSSRSILRYRRRERSRPPSQTWRTFLANHAQAIWAADLFVVQTLTF